ncbi:hypothetical protein GGI15_000273 [Coemansia interrupta]|uniref:Uncharacterized protein n=1 Tax=Coemansia interrupta TaxID=1126814 RepID=A0A9W8LP03_9FUNG|nr:hypothetical protein GGI15_000273 [Coemansia interrupta]
MVFGWQRSSSRRPKETKLVRAATTAAAMPAAANGRTSASASASVGRRTSLPARTTPPAVLAVPPAGPVAEDGCEVVPQFFPGYQTSSAASAGYSRGSPASACFPSPAAGGAQRRAGSVRVGGGGSADVGWGGAGRRRSDGSTLSNAETLVPMHNLPGCAPVFSTQDPMHVSAGYYPAQHPQMQHTSAPLRNDRRTGYATAPAGMLSDTHPSDPPSPADTCGSGGYRRASAVILPKAHEYYPPHSKSIVCQYSAKYHAGSYANRRRGDSIGGCSNGGSSVRSSATVSPASPAELYYDCYASAPMFPALQYCHGQRQLSTIRSNYYADAAKAASTAPRSALHRNNTTKTVSHNDLALDCHVVGTADKRRLSPSRSANFASHAPYSTHHATLLPSTPEGMVIDDIPATAHVTDECRLSLSDYKVCQSAVPMATTVSDSNDHPKNLDNISTDNADTVNLVSPVTIVVQQRAYLPPRSTILTITN